MKSKAFFFFFPFFFFLMQLRISCLWVCLVSSKTGSFHWYFSANYIKWFEVRSLSAGLVACVATEIKEP